MNAKVSTFRLGQFRVCAAGGQACTSVRRSKVQARPPYRLINMFAAILLQKAYPTQLYFIFQRTRAREQVHTQPNCATGAAVGGNSRTKAFRTIVNSIKLSDQWTDASAQEREDILDSYVAHDVFR